MTTWYRGYGVHDRTPIMAFSVRPDLWPPGTYCWTVGPADLVLADWAVQPGAQPDTRHMAPGAAEALVLSGQRVSSMGDTWGSTQTWTPWYRGPGDS